jgi:HEAT repeat protein
MYNHFALRSGVLALFIGFASFQVWGQNSNLLSVLANSTDIDQKLEAIQIISDNYDAGKDVSNDVTVLSNLAMQGNVGTQQQSLELRDVRIKAAACLGKIRGKEAYSTLIDMLTNESDSLVAAQAVQSLGQFKDDNNSSTIKNVTEVLERFEAKGIYDNTLANAVLFTVNKIGSTGNWSDTDISVVIGIRDDTRYSSKVRATASKIISGLKS